jgi:hypothetical protein
MIRAAAFAAVLALAPVAFAQQTAEQSGLTWKHEAGQELYYSYTWKLEQTQEVPNVLPPTPSLYEITYTLTQKITGVEAGVATIEAQITSIKVNLALGMMMGARMAYDSTQPDDGVNPLRPFRHVVGSGFSFKLTAKGAVSDVTGAESILAQLNEKAGPEVAAMGPMGGQLLGLLGVVFSASSLQGSLEIVNEVLPEGPLAEGESFETPVDMELPTMGRMTFVTENTHMGTERGKVTLEGKPKGEVKLEKIEPAEGEGDDPAGAGAREMGKQMAEGQEVTRRDAKRTAVFSTRHGRLEKSQIVMEIDAEGEPPQEIKMMLGEGAKDALMKQQVVLTLTYERAQTPSGQ